jgi:hypothetical protein
MERQPHICIEICNLLLNAVYDGKNVPLLIEADGVRPLFAFLDSSQHKVQSSALGAIQGICFVALGRHTIRSSAQNLEKLCSFLIAEESTVRARALGSIHNLSVDIQSIISLLEMPNTVPAVVSLLRDESPEICQVACGTLQNLSRDPHGREFIACRTTAVLYLSDLLCSASLSCQVLVYCVNHSISIAVEN